MTKHNEVIAAIANSGATTVNKATVYAMVPHIKPVTVDTVLADESNARYSKVKRNGEISLVRVGKDYRLADLGESQVVGTRSTSTANPEPISSETPVARVARLRAELATATAAAAEAIAAERAVLTARLAELETVGLPVAESDNVERAS